MSCIIKFAKKICHQLSLPFSGILQSEHVQPEVSQKPADAKLHRWFLHHAGLLPSSKESDATSERYNNRPSQCRLIGCIALLAGIFTLSLYTEAEPRARCWYGDWLPSTTPLLVRRILVASALLQMGLIGLIACVSNFLGKDWIRRTVTWKILRKSRTSQRHISLAGRHWRIAYGLHVYAVLFSFVTAFISACVILRNVANECARNDLHPVWIVSLRWVIAGFWFTLLGCAMFCVTMNFLLCPAFVAAELVIYKREVNIITRKLVRCIEDGYRPTDINSAIARLEILRRKWTSIVAQLSRITGALCCLAAVTWIFWYHFISTLQVDLFHSPVYMLLALGGIFISVLYYGILVLGASPLHTAAQRQTLTLSRLVPTISLPNTRLKMILQHVIEQDSQEWSDWTVGFWVLSPVTSLTSATFLLELQFYLLIFQDIFATL